MITPNIWTLNFRGLDFLNAEANTWFGKVAGATNAQDKADAQVYLDAVIAERNQRLKSYSGGVWDTVTAGLSAPFEALGGSGGQGAAGLAGGVTDTFSTAAADAAKAATTTVKTIAIVAAVGLTVAAVVYFSVGGRRFA